MTTTPTMHHRPASRVITLPDPDNLPASHDAEKDGTIEWRTETHNYPRFEIRFTGPNPFNDVKDLVIAGNDEQPVVKRLNNIGDYKYTIRSIKPDGNFVDMGPVPFNIRQCNGCLQPAPGPDNS